jgi:hypothetical protein
MVKFYYVLSVSTSYLYVKTFNYFLSLFVSQNIDTMLIRLISFLSISGIIAFLHPFVTSSCTTT